MTTFYCDVSAKLCAAAAALAAVTLPLGTNIYQGETNTVINVPCVVLYCRNLGEEDPHDSGNFWCELEIEVIYPAPVDANNQDTKAPNDLLIQQSFDCFLATNLLTALNTTGIADFTAQGCRYRTGSFENRGDQWCNKLTLQLLCCPFSFYP